MHYELTPAYLADVERRARRFQGQWTGTAGSLAADAIRLLFDRRRLLEELAAMTQQLEDANAQIRRAIEIRREAVAAGKPHDEWYAAMGESCCDGGKCHAPDIDEKGPLQDVDQVIAEDDEATKEAGLDIPADYILRAQDELRQEESDDIRWPGDSILATPPDGLRPGSREFVGVLDEIKQLHLLKTLDYGIDDDALSNIRESAEIVNMPAWAGCILRIYDKMHRLKAYFRRGKVEFDGIEDTLKDISSYAAIALVLYREQTGQTR